MHTYSKFKPETIHARLGAEFFDEVKPAIFPDLTLRYRDNEAAASVGLDHLNDEQWLAHFGRFESLPGSLPHPLALRYHGHQFRNYNPDLGDGRGFLFAQMRDLNNGRLLDFGTKGSGVTPWSRGGDGRLTLKGGVREILATRMLDALGVNTSKSYSLIETHEELMRGDEPSPTRSSVLVRLNHSHIRFGSFQRLAHLGETTQIARLIDHCLTHYLPQSSHDSSTKQALNFLNAVVKNVAQTTADWMQAGFVHGVLNTDNINITGESFDYGPWRFVPTCDPKLTAAYFDHNGLYAFARQPQSIIWNLTRLAECLLPFLTKIELEGAVEQFSSLYSGNLFESCIRRLGLISAGIEQNRVLTATVWEFLEASQMPFEQFFFDWFGGLPSEKRAMAGVGRDYYRGKDFENFRAAIANFKTADASKSASSYFERSTPVTMLIDEVEAIWAPIAQDDDWTLFENKMSSIKEMKMALC